MQLILASSSPRRKELLQMLRIPFDIKTLETDETILPGMSGKEAVEDLAYRKAKAVADSNQECCVIGADTVVVLDGQILGKPLDREDAARTLSMLSGKKHSVYTGVAIIEGQSSLVFSEKTDVVFWELSKEEIETYLDSGEPFDKAGSYGIQGYGSLLVKEISGDYYTVVGLPVSRLARELQAFCSDMD
ncbi:septum formation inhibitor Maf [Peribacillus saganii]|uniref:dTTP/UTP pyrophosphatase n=1 Tax=Peribacillus saganii TaxID=2303992 RepID=A0A372LUV6_9BACI|nr:Maf family protein [Peribacillus saganii]RFU71580.1 septum formation inhibitor Maf [Peribacillus saganii]